jgi:S1-C subfamily serine protease
VTKRILSILIPLAAIVAAAFALFPATAGAASLTRGVVDVTTQLGFQNGAAAGTGIVLSANGVVLTNNHVIRGATTVRVTDPTTKKSYSATVAGYDVANDVAVLRLKGATNLKPATLGDSSTVKVGDLVTAVGNAGGVGGLPSQARGKITGLNRTITAVDDTGLSEQLKGLLQTDAQLQPGDSGGPLFNRAGKVIGIDTAGSPGFGLRQSGNAGLAIPINRALTIARAINAGKPLATTHTGSTAFIGIQVSTAGSPTGGGVVVAGVVPSSPADSAGIQAGSVLTLLNGKPVTSYNAITNALLKLNAGSTITVQWTDVDGNAHTASVRAAAGPPQ